MALNSAGIYRNQGKPAAKDSDGKKKQEAITKGLEYLGQFCPASGVVRRNEQYFEYGHYYAAKAMWQDGGEPGPAGIRPSATTSSAGNSPTGRGIPGPTAPNMPPPCACWSCRCRKTSCRSSRSKSRMKTRGNTFASLHLREVFIACCFCLFRPQRPIRRLPCR